MTETTQGKSIATVHYRCSSLLIESFFPSPAGHSWRTFESRGSHSGFGSALLHLMLGPLGQPWLLFSPGPAAARLLESEWGLEPPGGCHCWHQGGGVWAAGALRKPSVVGRHSRCHGSSHQPSAQMSQAQTRCPDDCGHSNTPTRGQCPGARRASKQSEPGTPGPQPSLPFYRIHHVSTEHPLP